VFIKLLLSNCYYLIVNRYVETHEEKQNYEENAALKAFIAFNIAEGNKREATKKINQIELNDKTLLLIDGYDEVQNLDSEIFKEIKDSIFSHSNVIMTTRTNAADSSFK